MEDGFGIIITILVIIAIVGAFFILKDNSENRIYMPSNEEKNNLTNYLNNLEVSLYYSPNCSYCKEQEKYINFSSLRLKYNVLNRSYDIIGIPAWEYKFQLVYGLQTYKQLSKLYNYSG